MIDSRPVGLYLAVPFCKAKCSFCNFASDAFAPQRLSGYVDQLCLEITGAADRATRLGAQLPRRADSVYFGGGTPSLLLPEHLRQIFATLHEHFDLAPGAEITLECAPGQLTEEMLEELLRLGVNRLSLGVQSFIDREASAVGRLHTGSECEDEIARLLRAGLQDVGIDLIAGLPHQNEVSWRESVARTLNSGVTHTSIYMLEVDDGSRLGREVLDGGTRYGAAAIPDEDASAAWYEMGCEELARGGLAQYEISNFARAGHRSSHNTKYWRRDPYMGFGLDAHSMLLTEDGAVRFRNTDELDQYMLQDQPLRVLPRTMQPDADYLGQNEALEESLFLGLRMNEGVRLHDLRLQFGDAMLTALMPAVREICEAGLLLLDGDRLSLTSRGRMASNEVFSRLLVPATT